MRALALLALLLAPAVSGCIVESRLRADGGGTLRLQYRLDEKTTLGTVVQRLESPSVVVRSARIDHDRVATFTLQFADASALSRTQFFKNLSVTRAPGGEPGTTDWVAKVVQPKPVQIPDKLLEYYGRELKVTVTFPGPVIATNATSHEGATASWAIPLQTALSSAETVFTATWKNREVPSAPG